MPNLDGTEKIVATPFDQHEQNQAAAAANYEHQEYPKAVDHVDNPYGSGLEPVVVNNEDEEAAYKSTQEPA